MFSADCMKSFFKEENLSDRRLRIVEVEENISHSNRKRKLSEEGNLSFYFKVF